MVRNIDEVDARPRRPHAPGRGADHTAPALPVIDVLLGVVRTPQVVKHAFRSSSQPPSSHWALPMLAAFAVLVRTEGGPGVIIRQQRVGRQGVEFNCLKLRSIRPADSAESATNWSVAGDRRIGPVGAFLPRTSIDELPQLWTIVRRDMTLVGPRPERPPFVHKFSSEYYRHAHRHRVQAGLTGLAQVSGLREDTSIADRARYDNYYIEHRSVWLDIKIVIRTFAEVLFARGR